MNDGNLTSIIIALIGLVSLTITIFGGAVIYFAKWFSKNYGKDMREHTKAATKSTEASTKLALAVDKNTLASIGQVKSNDEVLAFMKNLNGKLAKATIQTVSEQKVIHQEVKEAVVEELKAEKIHPV